MLSSRDEFLFLCFACALADCSLPAQLGFLASYLRTLVIDCTSTLVPRVLIVQCCRLGRRQVLQGRVMHRAGHAEPLLGCASFSVDPFRRVSLFPRQVLLPLDLAWFRGSLIGVCPIIQFSEAAAA